MSWNAIGQSVIGSSHIQVGKPCEDALHYKVVTDPKGNDVMICCASDGAGSALYAAQAAEYVTGHAVTILGEWIETGMRIVEADIYRMAEHIYDGLEYEAALAEAELYEFSCTLLGCVIYKDRAAFFQTGDGAIVRNDGSGYFSYIWWPHNGEYPNTTSFLVDDKNFANLNILTIAETVNEVGLFTDGLQMLALSIEGRNVHQPFFANLFTWLRKAETEEQVALLNDKLATYLTGDLINSRTDDDKTLFIATRRPMKQQDENN